MEKKDEYEIGDEVCLWITGVVGDFRAKINGYDTRYKNSTIPTCCVLDPETEEPDNTWPKLKSGDYQIRGIWGT